MNYYSIILAAGKGTRMKSSSPKVLQNILEKPMVSFVIDELVRAGVKNNNLIVGYKKEEVIEKLNKNYENLNYVEQKEQLGTGHAVLQLKDFMKDLKGTTLITCGDTPLLTKEIFQNLISYHEKNNSDLTVLSTSLENPTGYGRIIRKDNNKVLKIVEQKDATEEEQKVSEINSGIYCINNELLFKHIEEIDNNNAQEEYYLTDIIEIFEKNNYIIDAYKTDDSISLMGVNDHIHLAKATKVIQKRINNYHLENGVKIIDPENTYIGKDVKIDYGTIIYPNNYIVGNTIIGKDNVLKTSNFIEDCKIGDNNQIGPMSYLRMNSNVKGNNRIGNFVELKNTTVEKGAKSAHLTYLGDAHIGENTNIGCGVITANYDGKNKYKTEIGNNTFIGSNVNLIAPVKVLDNVFVAAGTTVTKDVDNNKFVVGRVKEEQKKNKNK